MSGHKKLVGNPDNPFTAHADETISKTPSKTEMKIEVKNEVNKMSKIALSMEDVEKYGLTIPYKMRIPTSNYEVHVDRLNLVCNKLAGEEVSLTPAGEREYKQLLRIMAKKRVSAVKVLKALKTYGLALAVASDDQMVHWGEKGYSRSGDYRAVKNLQAMVQKEAFAPETLLKIRLDSQAKTKDLPSKKEAKEPKTLASRTLEDLQKENEELMALVKKKREAEALNAKLRAELGL